MDEQETNQEEEQEDTEDDNDEGNKSEESEAVTKLRKNNERLEKQLERKRELLENQKELEQREALGGGSEAGRQPVKPKEKTDEEYANSILPAQ